MIFSHFCPIVERRYVFRRRRALNDLSAEAVVTGTIDSETDEAHTKANKTQDDVTSLTERLKQLQTSVLINERAASEVADAAGKIKIKSTQAQVNASKLNSDYESTSDALNNRATLMGEAHTRALNLRERASQFFVGTSAKRKELTGATVAEQLARSSPTKANRAQFPAGSLDFRKWELRQTMPLVSKFSQGSPVSPAPSLRRYSIFTSITLIGSQDLAVKSSPNLFTKSLTLIISEEFFF
ncbi:hypothetical protein PR048_011109 [Dryococelus australis]|uniref:Uncharacterized protein n=1 Tax=Dryococelus australis TaxID=614101 RepID=A0ABQ9HKP3_9NEOP|nr:hypothetical protein PR048_011109 [Dryococelus australis]